jgi:signal transduction histidine kinase/ActR/RegA family two-component response regulator
LICNATGFTAPYSEAEIFAMTAYQQFIQKVSGLEAALLSLTDMRRKVDTLNILSRSLFVYEVDRSLRYAYEARNLAKQIGYEFGEAAAYVSEAMGCRIRSDFKKSKKLATEALAIFERLDDKSGQADALNNIAFMELNMEEFERAMRHGLKALTLALEGDEKDTLAFSLLVNGMLHELLGDYPRALEHHLASLALCQEIQDHAGVGAALINIGIIYRKTGEPAKARKHFEEAMELYEDLNMQFMVASASFNLGRVSHEAGDFQNALQFFRRSLEIQHNMSHAQGQGACFLGIGTALQKLGDYAGAEENIRQGIEAARAFGRKNSECKGQMQLADCYLDQKREHEAVEILEEVHHEAEIYGIKEIRHQVLMMLSKAYEIRGDYRKAFSFYKEATVLHDDLMNEEILLKMKGLMAMQDVEKARREREIALREKEQAQQSEKFKEQFLANMSHEIRTPMNAIVGLTGLLEKTSMDALQEKYVKAIHQSADSLLGIISEILDFSKIESGQIQLEQINFSVKNCMKEVLTSLKNLADEKSLAFTCTVDSRIPETLSGDPHRLKQILINLAGNGIKFTQQGSVNMSAALKESNESKIVIEFKVSDTGIGIPPDKIEDVFRSFVQATSGTTRQYGGTGLGLSISKQLVELQGGSISVQSMPDKGTTFTFEIPYQSPKEVSPKASASSETSLPKHLRVLVVEDNKFNQMVAVDSLQQLAEDAVVELAENGKAAMDKLAQKDFDLILLDLQMPVMDGYETIRSIREHVRSGVKEIPVIALTANATKTEKEKCLQAGMNGYISKPFRMEELMKQIQDVFATAE